MMQIDFLGKVDFTKPLMLLVRGIPGSGKTTMAKNQTGLVHIEADMYFSRSGEYLYDIEKLHSAHYWCLTTAQVLLNQGRDVVVANIFKTKRDIMPYVKYAKLNGCNIQIATMENDYGSVHGLTEEKMEMIRQSFTPHAELMEILKNVD